MALFYRKDRPPDKCLTSQVIPFLKESKPDPWFENQVFKATRNLSYKEIRAFTLYLTLQIFQDYCLWKFTAIGYLRAISGRN
jgi:hypothetical protein